MDKLSLIQMLQNDLENERKHMGFYLQAAVLVEGPHREELREFFEKEAASEMKHVLEFAESIVYLGGVPGTNVAPFPTDLTGVSEILAYVVHMEMEVADRYAKRVRETEEIGGTDGIYLHVFYEDQIKDSYRTAREVSKMLSHYQSAKE